MSLTGISGWPRACAARLEGAGMLEQLQLHEHGTIWRQIGRQLVTAKPEHILWPQLFILLYIMLHRLGILTIMD